MSWKMFLVERPDIGIRLERMRNYIAEQLRKRQIEMEIERVNFVNGEVEITKLAA
jgi:hypothetical protein